MGLAVDKFSGSDRVGKRNALRFTGWWTLGSVTNADDVADDNDGR